MGGSANWLKSLISHRKPAPDHQRGKRWKPWRCSSSSEGGLSSNRAKRTSDLSNPTASDVYSAAMAALSRASSRDFLMIRQEWAAIRIQTAFRALLARRALRALKALVRLQAIIRGRMVRKQAAVTLRCMQALVRAQTNLKARRLRASMEDELNKRKLEKKSHHVAKSEIRAGPDSKLPLSGPVGVDCFDDNDSLWSWLNGCMEEVEVQDSTMGSDSTITPMSSEQEEKENLGRRVDRKRVGGRPLEEILNEWDWRSSSRSLAKSKAKGRGGSDMNRLTSDHLAVNEMSLVCNKGNINE